MNNDIKLKIKKILPWIIRILIFAIFMVSGIAKLFPVWAFEKQIVDLGIASWCYAPYLARLIIAIEIGIGISILQPHYLKKFVIPATILLLLAFCVHLSLVMIQQGAMNGNCGCFGQLIPMTPFEAFIKNIVTIGLLVYLYFNVSNKEKGKNKIIFLVLIYLASALILFMAFPFCPCKDAVVISQPVAITDTAGQHIVDPDSLLIKNKIPEFGIKENSAANSENKKNITTVFQVEKGPAKVISRFSEFTSFGNETVDLNQGKKILCFFVPGCDECRIAARKIDSLSKLMIIPPVYILFMNEETEKIPEFFIEANCKFPYRIIEIPVFWGLLGSSANTPGVFYLWNGNIIRFYEGTENNKFNPEDLRKVLVQT